MASSNCRWFPAPIPAAFLGSDGKINMGPFSTGDQAVLLVGEENWGKIGEAVALDIQGSGEDAADAVAVIAAAKVSVAQDNATGKWYALVDASQLEYGTYAQLFVLKCGAMAGMPYIVGGALLLGLIGFGVGYAKKGVPAYGLMGATVGLAAGALGGYALAGVFTPKYMKTAGMGLLDVRMGANAAPRRLRRARSGDVGTGGMCPYGMVWNEHMQQCIRLR